MCTHIKIPWETTKNGQMAQFSRRSRKFRSQRNATTFERNDTRKTETFSKSKNNWTARVDEIRRFARETVIGEHVFVQFVPLSGNHRVEHKKNEKTRLRVLWVIVEPENATSGDKYTKIETNYSLMVNCRRNECCDNALALFKLHLINAPTSIHRTMKVTITSCIRTEIDRDYQE